ncbi:uncharacterized protein LOC119445247 [Dermacentor silvarum]|uniref:uncharacterized protein LOC119445247 n=1 Tax=Dermacentor silvarum TaxID=543639 RepID=UPI0021011D3A|nr:uncharacterized protein LOC119445247 [Dermacentor silvarum]
MQMTTTVQHVRKAASVVLQILLLHSLVSFGAQKAGGGRRPPVSSPQGSSNASCSMAEFDACMRKLSSITESDELALASTRHELDILCSKWKAGHRCVDEHMSRCSDRLKQILYNDVVHGTRQVMNELCSPGRMQNDYLRLAPCFKSLFVEGGKCSQKYKSMIQWSKASTDMTEAANVEEGLRRTCCTFNEYVHCYYVHMPELCGEEGRDFFRTYTEKMSGPLIHEHCASYTYDSTCSEAASTAAPTTAAPRQHRRRAAAACLLLTAAATLL